MDCVWVLMFVCMEITCGGNLDLGRYKFSNFVLQVADQNHVIAWIQSFNSPVWRANYVRRIIYIITNWNIEQQMYISIVLVDFELPNSFNWRAPNLAKLTKGLAWTLVQPDLVKGNFHCIILRVDVKRDLETWKLGTYPNTIALINSESPAWGYWIVCNPSLARGLVIFQMSK